MSRDDERARAEFTGEADELLEALSRDLSDFEAQGTNVRPELINKIFREVHSLKGLAGMLGYTEISELSHNLEDMLDRLRMGKIEITRELIDLLYDSIDSLNRLVLALNDPSVSGLLDITTLVRRIHQIASSRPQQISADPFAELEIDDQTKKSLTEYEEHRLLENVRAGKHIHSVEVTFDFADFDEKLRALSTTLNEAGEIISTLPAIDTSGRNGISFRLLYGSSLNDSAVAAMAPDGRVVSVRKVAPARVVEEGGGAASEPPADDDVSLRSLSQTVRVDIGKLDRVMNIVGELIVERTQLEALAGSHEVQQIRLLSHELTKVSRNLDRKLSELQKSVIETRLVPVAQIYSKLSRAVRKVARELNKEIDLVLRGEQTELDKMMVEELTDPLMHIIRNALDHGIEPAEVRRAAGKPPNGIIRVTAQQQGSSVVLEVSDDGRGIDPGEVREVAVRHGLLDSEEVIDAKRAYELLFTPGFSTAASVTGISGRGVGLDVVKKNIQELKGTIDITSTPGEGTTFRIMLPITLAIIQALLVRAGGETFALPLTAVEESLRIHSRDIRTVERREVFELRNGTIPLLRLADAFGLASEPEESEMTWFAVVTRAGQKKVGILVESLLRQQEIVIKSIGDRLKNTPGVAGATEIGESEIVLVVDVASLIDHFGGRTREARSMAG